MWFRAETYDMLSFKKKKRFCGMFAVRGTQTSLLLCAADNYYILHLFFPPCVLFCSAWQEAAKLFAKLKGLLEQDEGAECAIW